MENNIENELEVFKHIYLKWFHKNCVFNNKWMGRQAQKNPFDTWVYQEIVHETKPSVIIEIGNYEGGSTLYLANLLDSLGSGKVIGVDVDHRRVQDLVHKRIKWITGDGTSPEVFLLVKNEINTNDRVMIIEDSSHEFNATLSILNLYSSLVSLGCYFVVEDGICKEDYIDGPKPGPYEAVHAFIKDHPEFEIDRRREKFLLTYNPDGFLKRIS